MAVLADQDMGEETVAGREDPRVAMEAAAMVEAVAMAAVVTVEAMVDDNLTPHIQNTLGTLLLLEDDPMLAKSLIKYLEGQRYHIDWAKHGEEALDLSYENHYLLYLIDINVPLLNGVDLLQSLREAGDMTPAIIISAQIDLHSVTQGFIAGADDYLKKPFDPEELLIRIKAKTHALQTLKRIGSFEVDLDREEIYRHGSPFYLPDVQKRIFFSLVRNHPNPVAKEELLLLLEKPTDLALRVNIAKMKKNLDLQVKSIRGVGYQII